MRDGSANSTPHRARTAHARIFSRVAQACELHLFVCFLETVVLTNAPCLILHHSRCSTTRTPLPCCLLPKGRIPVPFRRDTRLTLLSSNRARSVEENERAVLDFQNVSGETVSAAMKVGTGLELTGRQRACVTLQDERRKVFGVLCPDSEVESVENPVFLVFSCCVSVCACCDCSSLEFRILLVPTRCP